MTDAINYDALFVDIHKQFEKHGVHVYELDSKIKYNIRESEEIIFTIRSGRSVSFDDLQKKHE